MLPLLLDWRRDVDFLVLSATLYMVLRWASRARALRLALSITAVYAGVLVARRFDLILTSWILQGVALVSVMMLIIVFQPEVRRALTRLDRTLLFPTHNRPIDLNRALAESAFELAAAGLGALFVVAGQDPLDDLLEGGVQLAAQITKPLLIAIFQKTSPLHDGAAVIEGETITRAGAVLPLTHRNDVPFEYGTRHRAAMGLAERTDAICITVSEERSEVTVMRGRAIMHMGTPDQLSALLEHAFVNPKLSTLQRIRLIITDRWKLKLASIGLAALIWSAAIFDPSSTVRVIAVPIEFQNVPRGLDIAEESATELAVQLRGRAWMMDSNQLTGLLARVNLRGASEGTRTVHIAPSVLGLPPGVTMIHVNPEYVKIRLARHNAASSR